MRRPRSRRISQTKSSCAHAEPLEPRMLLSAAILVKDINTTRVPFAARNLTVLGENVFFTASDGYHGYELWKTDGVTCSMVKDITPGPASVIPDDLMDVDGVLYFSVGAQLWRSDGTDAGTVCVQDATASATTVVPLGSVNGTVIFTVDGTLWRTDGTAAGTSSLGAMTGSGTGFAAAGGTAFFAGYNATTGTELWATDGTPAGTRLVKDILPGTGSSSVPTSFVSAGGVLYFAALDGTSASRQLWRSDGTDAGTQAVYGGAAGGPAITSVSSLTVAGGRVFMAARTTAAGNELWVTDGTAVGTVMVRDINPGTASSSPLNLIAAGDRVLLWADDGVHGRTLWATDGTADGTATVSATTVGSPYSSSSIIAAGGRAYWLSSSGGDELWSSDGTAAGTSAVNLSVSQGFFDNSLAVLDGGIFFTSGGNPDWGYVWRSDGTAAGTTRIDPGTTNTAGSLPYYLTPLGTVSVFVADDGVHAREPWRTDGTAAGTYLLKDINPAGTSSINGFVTSNGWAYFAAYDPTYGTELWATNGFSTTRLTDISPGTGSSSPLSITASGGYIYFTATSPTTGRDLWKLDPVSWSVTKVLNSSTSYGPEFLTDVGGTLFFVDNFVLCRTYGGLVTTIRSFSAYGPLANVMGRLFFSASTPATGYELWVSDGTSAGTSMVKDLYPTGSSNPVCFAPLGNTLLFTATDGVNGFELWRSDGTAAGTYLLKDINPGSAGSNIRETAVVGSVVYFSATTAAEGAELWRTDGTSAGTYLVKDALPGPESSSPNYITAVGGGVYFGAMDADRGFVLWRSDGTAAGTAPALNTPVGGDVSKGVDDLLVAPNGSLLFSGNNGGTGDELWSLPAIYADAGGGYYGFYSVAEGGAVRLDASASRLLDPAAGPLTYLWDLDGDGVYGETGAGAKYGDEVGASPTFVATLLGGPGSVPIALRVSGGGRQATASATVSVNNVAPTATFDAPLVVNERSTVTLRLLNPMDVPADVAAGFMYTFDFGDDGRVVEWPSPTVTHTYYDSGTYVVSGRIIDKNFGFTEYTATVTVLNAAPLGTFYDVTGNEGQPVTLEVTDVFDSSGDVNAGFTYSFDLDGDGVFEVGPSAGSSVQITFPDSGRYTVRARITDKDGDSTVYAATAIIANVVPETSLSGPASIVEGSGATVTFGPVTDAPGDVAAGFTYSYDFDNDGTFEIAASSSPDAVVPAAYLGDGPIVRSVRGRIADKDGAFRDYIVAITVTNAAPSAAFADASATAGVPTTLTVTGATDASAVDIAAGLRYSFDLDNNGTFETPLSTSPSTTVTFFTAGPRTVRAMVRDKDGGVSVHTATVSVSLPPPPTAAFSSGGAVDEGSSGFVSFAGATGALPLIYSYDFDNDGTLDAGSTSAAAVVPAAYLADGPFTRTVRGRVTDRFGQSADYTAGILVLNVAPTLAMPAAADGSVILGTRYTLSLGSFDPGRDGVTSWRVAWDDGTSSDLHAATGVVGHDYAAAGTYHVTVTATDDDGSYSEARSVAVTAAPPAAAFAAGALAGDGSAYTFTVTYTDDLGIDTATLGNGDFQISGPAGTALARLVSLAAGEGNSVVATYGAPSPLGTWSWQDSGQYSVSARAGEVKDLQGIAVAAGEVGGFTVSLSPAALPDLVGAFAGAAPKSLTPGGKGTVSVKVSNRGAKSAPAASWTTRLYLSADGTIDSADVLLGTSVQKGVALPINGSKSFTIPYTVPKAIAGGQYRLLLQVDATGAVAERDERNNVTAAPGLMSVITPSADLSTSFATKLKPTYKTGESMVLGLKVTNAGPSEANGAATVRFFFSADPVLDEADQLVLTSALPLKLKAKASAVFNKTVKVPAGLPAGKWYVLAVTDGSPFGDRNARNNATSASFRI